MKIEVPLTNAVRFPLDETTVLHLHTGQVDPLNRLLIKPEVGPKVHLRTDQVKFPDVDAASPYGSGQGSFTGILFGEDFHWNYGTTAGSSHPVLPDALNAITGTLRLSLFFRPDNDLTGGPVLIAGIPERFGLYQVDQSLVLRLHGVSGTSDCELDYSLEIGVWHLLEVQWDKDRNGGVPMWYLNGVPCDNWSGSLEEPLDAVGDRFNLAHDPAQPGYWGGTIRELELANGTIWVDDEATTDKRMYARATQLFGLATPSTPVPSFSRASVGWIRVGGVLHKLSWHHPRASALGTVVEEMRTNVIVPSAPQPSDWPYVLTLAKGRYTVWFEQESNESEEPVTLTVTIQGDDEIREVIEHEPLVFEVPEEGGTQVTIARSNPSGSIGSVTHLQLEAGVGPTTHIVTTSTSGPVSREVETLAYLLTESDIDQEQGRLDLSVTPQLTGVRALVDEEALGGDILAMSLTREEIVSVDASGDDATLPGAGLWQAWKTRSFHVEWQPGTRVLVEDSLELMACADYSGGWPETSGYFYVGGGGGVSELRANCFFRGLVLDDQVTRFHADLHRALCMHGIRWLDAFCCTARESLEYYPDGSFDRMAGHGSA